MLLKKLIVAFLAIPMVVLSACNLPVSPVIGGTIIDPAAATAAVQTAVANSVASSEARQTGLANAVASTLAAMATNTSEFTLTPSLTPTLTLTPTPTFTLTPTTPKVSVSVATNCRFGPGTVYDILGGLAVGQVADVVGKSAAGDNWIIRLPSNPAITCWIWGQYATINGDTTHLPVIQPPPTPTPAIGFLLTYDSFVTCGGLFAVKFKIVNNGSLTWESNQVNATDQTTSVTKTINRNSFMNFNGCVVASNDNNLEPGESGITTSSGFAANPSGHNFSATIQVCSGEGQAGTCMAKTITFTP